MTTEQYQIGYEAGYSDGFDAGSYSPAPKVAIQAPAPTKAEIAREILSMSLPQLAEYAKQLEGAATQAPTPGWTDGCTEENCQRCRTHPNHRGDMQHAGIGSYPPSPPASAREPESKGRADSKESELLVFADAVRIARGCTDYSGGYRGDPALYEAYQSGILTVVTALDGASKRGLEDSQIRALHRMGAPDGNAELSSGPLPTTGL